MRVLNDYHCDDCGAEFEELAEASDPHVPCIACEGHARRAYRTMNFKLDGTDPGYPTAWDQWARKRKQRMAQESD